MGHGTNFAGRYSEPRCSSTSPLLSQCCWRSGAHPPLPQLNNVQDSLQEIFTLILATVSHYVHFSLEILLVVLQSMCETYILWPCGPEFPSNTALVSACHPLLTGAFGSMHGLNLPVQVLDDTEIENATYNGWLHGHFVSLVFVFSPQGTCQCLVHSIKYVCLKLR